VALIGIGIASYSFLQANWDARETEQLALQTHAQQQRYEEVASNFPTTPIPSAELKTAVDLAASVKQYNITPEEMMRVLSGALETSPEIAIERLRWMQTDNVEVQDAEKAREPNANNATSQAATLRQIAFVSASLSNFNGDYRGALNSVNQFVAQIKNNPKVEQVMVLQEPVNASSFASLQGSTLDENTSEQVPAMFKLKVVLKPMVETGVAR